VDDFLSVTNLKFVSKIKVMSYLNLGDDFLTKDTSLSPNTLQFRSTATKTELSSSDIRKFVRTFPNDGLDIRVEIGSGITDFESVSLFYGQKMKEVYFLPNNNAYETDVDGMFYGCKYLAKVDLSQCFGLKDMPFVGMFEKSGRLPDSSQGSTPGLTVLLPPNLESLRRGTFMESTIVNLLFPPSFTLLRVNTFLDAKHLHFVDLSSTNLTMIPNRCFRGAGNIGGFTVHLPSSVITIHPEAFAFSTLKTINIPPNATVTISEETLVDTVGVNVTRVMNPPLPPPPTFTPRITPPLDPTRPTTLRSAYWDLGGNTLTFDETLSPDTIHFRGSRQYDTIRSRDTSAASVWNFGEPRFVMGEGITDIEDRAFHQKFMKEVYFLPNNNAYEKRSERIFYHCRKLAKVDLSQCFGIKHMPYLEMFYRSGRVPDASQGDTPGLTVLLPPNLESLRPGTFMETTIVNIVFPLSLTSLSGGFTFLDAKHLKFVDLSATSLTILPPFCFKGAGAPEGFTVLLPPTLLEISTNAFDSSTLPTINIPPNVIISDFIFPSEVVITRNPTTTTTTTTTKPITSFWEDPFQLGMVIVGILVGLGLLFKIFRGQRTTSNR
jgi:uncharacterized membrane protein YqaE (UPF0057 family)